MELTKKQECIRKAYGELYDKLKEFIDIDGNCVMFDRSHNQVTPNFSELGFERDYVDANIDNGYDSELGVHKWRPKSLQGIENNRGWFSVEEHGLPTEDGWYKTIDLINKKYINSTVQFSVDDKECADKWLSQFSHYKPLTKQVLPLY